MIDESISEDGGEEARRRDQPSIIPLAYATTGGNPLAGAVRALGLVCIVLGTLRFFILNPLSIFLTLRQSNPSQQSQRTALLAIFITTELISLILSAVQLITGVAALRLRPGALRALCVWSWCFLAYLVLGLTANTWYSLHFYAGGLRPSTIAYVVCYLAERWLPSVTVPLVTLMLFRSRSFRSMYIPEQTTSIAR